MKFKLRKSTRSSVKSQCLFILPNISDTFFEFTQPGNKETHFYHFSILKRSFHASSSQKFE